MEPNLNHHSPTNQFLDVSKVIPDRVVKKSDVVYFLEDLYTYPPKIKIQWARLDSVRKSDKVFSNKITHNSPRKSFLGIRDYADKVTSSDFYNKKTKPLKQALKNVPVYVVVNGRTELVLATASSGKFHHEADLTSSFNVENGDIHETDIAQKRFSGRKGSKRVAEKALSTKSKKFSFMFLDRIEAELYLDMLIERAEKSGHTKRDNGIDKVGLSIHCIGLNTAYSLLTRSSNVDFRFVPSLTEVTTLLKSEDQGDVNSELFAEGQQLDPTLSEKVLLPLLGQSNFSFKGVPIYLLQVRDEPRNLVSDGRGNLVNVIDSLHEAFTSGFDTFIRPNNDKTESIAKFKQFKQFNPNGSANYVFFDREQAIELSQKFNRRIASYNAENDLNSREIINDYPIIYTHNLEDFLESWEESLLLNTNNTTFPIKGDQPTYFIPSKRSTKTLEQYYNRPKDSLGKSIKVWGRRKLDKLFWFQTNYLGLVLRGSRI